MRERAVALDAELEITSREGAGTNVELRVPRAARQPDAEEDQAG
jgi:nitrate/nitrite-specific signal transduction histidine kinase